MPLPSKTFAEAAVQLNRSDANWLTELWTPIALTYAFRATDNTYGDNHLGTNSFSVFNAQQIAATELALQAWADVANIVFTRVGGTGYSDHATLLFGGFLRTYPDIGPSVEGEGVHGYAYLPDSVPSADDDTAPEGDVWINNYWTYTANPQMWRWGQAILVHEIGHALGLEHPGDYNRGTGAPATYAADALYREDTAQYTVMSYFSELNTGANFGGWRTPTPMLHDIAAVQRLFGANMTTRTGDTIYGFNSNAGTPWFSATSSASPLVFCLWDAGGTDTLDFSGYTVAQLIDLRAGQFSDVGGLVGNVSIANGVTIENAVGGSGADTITGNNANNRLRGGPGSDALAGGGGTDTAVCIGPASIYSITLTGSGCTVSGPEGNDTLNEIERVAFADRTVVVRSAPVFDFSGEGRGDVLFQHDDGTVAVWLQNGLVSTGADAIHASAAGGWRVKGAADFDGDANADVLLQNAGTGAVAAWLMNGLAVASADAIHAVAGAGWQVAGTGDFNGDLKHDVLLQNSDGHVAVWLMNGFNLLGGDALTASADGGWQICGIGDFNADASSDILLQHTDGRVAIWLMSGLAVQAADAVPASAGTDWKVKGVGDFNGDGKSDILLFNQTTSAIAVWLMNGLSLIGGDAIAASAAGGWQVKGAEDLDGNGLSDILLQNTNGQVGGWLMNGLQIAGADTIGSSPGSAWHIISPTG